MLPVAYEGALLNPGGSKQGIDQIADQLGSSAKGFRFQIFERRFEPGLEGAHRQEDRFAGCRETGAQSTKQIGDIFSRGVKNRLDEKTSGAGEYPGKCSQVTFSAK